MQKVDGPTAACFRVLRDNGKQRTFPPAAFAMIWPALCSPRAAKEGAMRSEKKEIRGAARSASIAAVFVTAIALVTLGLSLTPGSGTARAEARSVAAAAASSGQGSGAVAAAETDEMNSAPRVPGHSEL